MIDPWRVTPCANALVSWLKPMRISAEETAKVIRPAESSVRMLEALSCMMLDCPEIWEADAC